jgi:hypothetical protein
VDASNTTILYLVDEHGNVLKPDIEQLRIILRQLEETRGTQPERVDD